MPNLFYYVAKGKTVTPPKVIEISAGSSHTMAITNKNVTWGWGNNLNGQLGDNTTSIRTTPVSVQGAVKTFCQISAGGNNFTMAIDKNGRAWGWGINGNGQLGNNSTTSQRTPVSVAGAVKTFCQISAGVSHTTAIDKNGRAWGWGGNGNGQLGDNTTSQRNTPVSVVGVVKTFCQISAGNNHTMVIDKNGRAWGWGNNPNGQLGDNSITSQLTPVSVLGAVKTFCHISAGNSHTMAIDKNGRAWGWGLGFNGRLGTNSGTSQRTPASVAGAVKTFCQISTGGSYTMAIDKNGRAWGWGLNNNGELGDNSTGTQRLTPVSVAGAVKTFCQISAGVSHTTAIDKNGRAWGWGLNNNGQLGNGVILSHITPVSVLGAVKTFCQINAGNNHTTAIDKNGRVWTWGNNQFGQLGDNSTNQRLTPVSVLGTVKTFCQINNSILISNQNYTVAIDKNGRAWGWGINNVGQLGDNSTTTRRTPVSVLGAIKTFCQISAGNIHTVAIDKNGRAWGWGFNGAGRLGDNSTTQRNTPVSVEGAVKTFCQIIAGSAHTIAIDKNGRAWGWGVNGNGQLGDNSTNQRLTPVSVLGAVKTFCQISAGGNSAGSHTMAIDKNGRSWGWGLNSTGQLGDNSVTSRRTPVSVLGAVKTFCQISAGGTHTMAIDKNGRAWGWGDNGNGQLGNNSITSQRTPVSVLGTVKTFCQISAGTTYTMAIDKNGRAWGWGLDTSGELGVNVILSHTTPILITYL
jgi:alpha-tubulin suppressor-like RCC1 family protein